MTAPQFAGASPVPTNPSKNTGMKSLVGSQAGNRYIDTFHDQHRFSRSPLFANGRPWCGSREMSAMKGAPDGFLGELQPGEYFATGPEDDRHIPTQTPEDRIASLGTAWGAPWFPEWKYVDFQWRTKRMVWRYDRVSADYKLEQRTYYQAANKIAAHKGWAETPLGAYPSFQIVSVLGEPNPKHDPRLPQAAQAGDPWLLGFTDEVNVQLAKVLAYQTDSWGLVTALPQQPLKQATPETVQQVLGMDPEKLEALIQARVDAAMEAKERANKDKMAAVRAAKKAKTTPATANTPS